MSTRPGDGSRQLEPELEPLRRAFTVLADETPEPASCPEPDRLWAAVHGELPGDEVHDLIDHTASCASCAEAWRLAREVGRPLAETVDLQISTEPAGGRVLTMGQRFRRAALPLAGLAAAAVLLLVVGLPRESPPPSAVRAGDTVEIVSLVPQDESLARDHCLLRWSEVEGALYDVLVSDAELVVVSRAEDLTEARFLVPEASLEGLSAGAELYWQVEAVLADGSSVTSQTFVHRLE